MRAFRLPAAALVAACWATTVSAQDAIRREPVELTPGASSTTVRGAITGYETVDYLVEARAGQTMAVRLGTNHTANYFNVIPPDAENEGVFTGSLDGDRFRAVLDLDGDWRIRVYLMRSAARRGESAAYSLAVEVTGEPDATVAREASEFGPLRWDARGRLGCANGGEPMRPSACPFKVIRYTEGATVFVQAPGTGRERILYYQGGAWSTDSAEPIQALQRSDLWTLVVGDEAYEVPDAVLFGG